MNCTSRIKLLFFVACILIISDAKAQSVGAPAYDLRADAHWLDSLKHTLTKKISDYPETKKDWAGVWTYINNSQTLGLYYERMFDKKSEPDMRRSIFYYNKIIGLPRFPDDAVSEQASAVRTTLYRKLADIYFKGKGVKKNRELSLELALSGFGDHDMCEFYSQRYFGCNCNLIKQTEPNDFSKDMVFHLRLNPFAVRGYNGLKLSDKENLVPVANAFAARAGKENLLLLINVKCKAAMLDQALAYRLADHIQSFLVKEIKTGADDILTNVEISDTPVMTLEISFDKKEK